MGRRNGNTRGRMFRKEILSKTHCIWFDCARLDHASVRRIGLPYGRVPQHLCAAARRQENVGFAFLDEAHGGSNRSVTYLKDARLERSLRCWRRENEVVPLSQGYACQSLRAGDFARGVPGSTEMPAYGQR
jgi:hypothetical protein